MVSGGTWIFSRLGEQQNRGRLRKKYSLTPQTRILIESEEVVRVKAGTYSMVTATCEQMRILYSLFFSLLGLNKKLQGFSKHWETFEFRFDQISCWSWFFVITSNLPTSLPWFTIWVWNWYIYTKRKLLSIAKLRVSNSILSGKKIQPRTLCKFYRFLGLS